MLTSTTSSLRQRSMMLSQNLRIASSTFPRNHFRRLLADLRLKKSEF